MIAFILGAPAGERLAAVIDPDAPRRPLANVDAPREPTQGKFAIRPFILFRCLQGSARPRAAL